MRKETQKNLFLGKSLDGEFVFLDYAFEYEDWGMKGLVFSIFNFHTEEEKNQALEDYDFYDLWKEAVASDQTTQSLEDWTDEVKSDFEVYDESYRGRSWLNEWVEQAKKEDWVDYSEDATECIWWGRSFAKWMLCEESWEWLAYPEAIQDLEKLAKEYWELE